jgi:hypothetical protein
MGIHGTLNMVDIILSAVQVVMKTPEEETLVREAEGRLKDMGIWFDTGNTIEWPRIREWCLDDTLECENPDIYPMNMIVTELLGLNRPLTIARHKKLEQGIKDTIQTMRAADASLLRGFIADLEELLTNDS